MPNSVRYFPGPCDPRQLDGGGCFCAFRTSPSGARPYTYKWVGAGGTGVFAYANGTHKLTFLDQLIVAQEPLGCTWRFQEEYDPGPPSLVRNLQTSVRVFDPLPLPYPDTAQRCSLFVDIDDPMLPPNWSAQSGPVNMTNQDPAVEPTAPFVGWSTNHPTDSPPTSVILTPRRWDWNIGDPY